MCSLLNVMKCLFRFFHSFKVGIHPKLEGGTVHKLLKQCIYTLRAKDGILFFNFFLGATSFKSHVFILHPRYLTLIHQ